jgi:hypothetical protein
LEHRPAPNQIAYEEAIMAVENLLPVTQQLQPNEGSTLTDLMELVEQTMLTGSLLSVEEHTEGADLV